MGDKERTQALKDAALSRLGTELAMNFEQQLENDALIWARTIHFDARPQVKALLQKIFALLWYRGVFWRPSPAADAWRGWSWPTAALLSHGARVLIQYPASYGLEDWLGFESAMTTRYSTHYVAPITHGAGGKKRGHDYKHDAGNLAAAAEFGGRKFVREVSLKVKDGTDYFTGAPGFFRQVFNKGTNWGLNLAIGGDSDAVRKECGEPWVWFDPTDKPIRAQGGHGHLFLFHREGITAANGTSWSAILIGCENSAPKFFKGPGTKTNKGALTGAHGPAGTRNPVAATGGSKWSEIKDAALGDRPDNFDCLFTIIDKDSAPPSSIPRLNGFDYTWLSNAPLQTTRPAPTIVTIGGADATLYRAGWTRALGR